MHASYVNIGTNDGSLHAPRFQKTRGGLILCLDEQTGQLLWQLMVPRFRTIRAGSEKKVLNRIRFPHRIYNTPVVTNGVMYVATERYLYAIGE